MKILTSTDIKNWAGTLESQSQLPLLIRKLIYAGVNIEHIKSIDFPFGEDVQVGGYDGQLETEEGNLYIPEGNSVWEFGVVESGKKAKADGDYEKRKADPLGKTPSETTYINVTLKKYTKKQQWADAKSAEGFWADVKFYDAVDIEHWLDVAPSVEIWLARLLGKPVLGVQCGDDYWEQWSTKGDMKFPYNLLTDSRDIQKEKLMKSLSLGKGTIIQIKSNTQEESLAFGLAALESLEEDSKNSFHSKSLVVDDRDSFRQLIESKNELVLLAKFKLEDTDANRAVTNGHKVIVPLSNSFSSNGSNCIVLPIVRGEIFRDSLGKMGINREQAQLLSVNTGKDISVLRRNLKFSSKQPVWLEKANPLSFIPFLLIARYDANLDGDKEIVERITGKKYDNYEKELRLILNSEETPIYKVGTRWRLISHSDSWLYLAKYITEDDLKKLYDVAVEVLTETNPKYGLDPEKRYMASFFNATPKYSHYLKKGICETLIILSVLAKKYGLTTVTDPEHYVDGIIGHIMSLADGNLLRSFGHNLSLLAEASPSIFLNNIQEAIDAKKVENFFEEENALLHSTNDLPHLLWSLEKVAWMPEHLTKVIRIICQLIQMSPKKLPTSNTPFNTLVSIFRIWLPQTNAKLEEREQVLEVLKREYPNIAFNLFSSLVYSNSDYGTIGTKMRWRLFSETREVRVTNQELNYMHSYSVDSLIELATESDFSRVLVLIDKIDDVNWDKVDSMLECIESYINESEENKAVVYHNLRQLIGRHRTYSETNWSLPEAILKKLENTALNFKPTDLILSESYLFEEHHPILIEGAREDIKNNYRKQEEEFNKLREKAIVKFLEVVDVTTIVDLSKKTKNSYFYANALAKTELNEAQESIIFNLVNSEDHQERWFFGSYISSKERLLGREVILKKIEQLRDTKKYPSAEISLFLLPLFADLKLFKYIDSLNDPEIEKVFWSNSAQLYTSDSEILTFAIKKLAKYDRPITVLNTLARARMDNDKLSTEFIISTLEDLNLKEYNEPENVRVDHYLIRDIFSDLHTRDDVDEDKMAEIEFKLLFIFDKYGHGILPKYLYKAVAKTPSLYIDLIKSCFRPKDENLLEEQNDEISAEQRKMIFDNAYSIISNFNLIPGLQEDDSIIEEDLNNWIDEVRVLAEACGRGKITDSQIGQILARYPNREGKISFPNSIHDALERIDSIDVYRGFGSQVFNRMGATSRAVDSGGYIERDRAAHFNSLAEKIKISHSNVAEIYRGLARGYEHDAKREDEEALSNILEY